MEFPFEREAMRGDPMPEGLRIYEQAAYQALRYLYAMYHRKAISREDAAREKNQVRFQYDRAKADFEANRRNLLAHARMWKEIEEAANRFGQERTMENAEAFVQAVYGCRLKKEVHQSEEQKKNPVGSENPVSGD